MRSPGALEKKALFDDMFGNWGQGRGLEIFAPSLKGEGQARRFGAFERAVGSPAMVRARSISSRERKPLPATSSLATSVSSSAGSAGVSYAGIASSRPSAHRRQASDSALTTASAELKWMNGWSAAATFEGEFSNVSRSYAGKGVVRYQW